MAREGVGPSSDSRCYLVSRLDHVGVFRRSSLVPISSRMPNDKWMELGRSPTDQTAVSKKDCYKTCGSWYVDDEKLTSSPIMSRSTNVFLGNYNIQGTVCSEKRLSGNSVAVDWSMVGKVEPVRCKELGVRVCSVYLPPTAWGNLLNLHQQA